MQLLSLRHNIISKIISNWE